MPSQVTISGNGAGTKRITPSPDVQKAKKPCERPSSGMVINVCQEKIMLLYSSYNYLQGNVHVAEIAWDASSKTVASASIAWTNLNLEEKEHCDKVVSTRNVSRVSHNSNCRSRSIYTRAWKGIIFDIPC